MTSNLRRELTLLVDYRDHYYCTLPQRQDTMSTRRLAAHLERWGWTAEIRRFDEVELRDGRWRGRFVFYQSAQDRDLHYKGYIEDVVLGLSMAGAVVVPDFAKLKAHHNKVFMEFLRDVSDDPALRSLRARHFGTFEEFAAAVPGLKFPLVLKSAATDLSRGVELARNAREALRHARRLSRSWHPGDAALRWWRQLTKPEYRRESLHRRKFIVQDLVAGASEDERVLVFGDRYYWLHRQSRPGDFRASGSGMPKHWPLEPPPGLLETARRVYEHFDVPYLHLDLIVDASAIHVIEYQFIRFGVNAVMNAPHHFVREGDGFRRVEGNLELEETFARAMVQYLERKRFADG